MANNSFVVNKSLSWLQQSTVPANPTLWQIYSDSVTGDLLQWNGTAWVTFGQGGGPSGYTSTVTAAGTTVLTSASTYQQYFTGTSTQIVQLPVVSTLTLGQQFSITNLSTGSVTVQSSGANTLQVMAPSTLLVATVISTSGTGTASWSWTYQSLTSSGPLGYWSGYFGNAAIWTTTNTSFTDPTFSGTAGFTQRTGSGITVTAGAGNVVGFTFTPPVSTAVYSIKAAFASANSIGYVTSSQLTDGTTVIDGSGSAYVPGISGFFSLPTTLQGIYAPGTTSAVTVKIQLATTTSGTAFIEPSEFAALATSVEFSIFRIA